MRAFRVNCAIGVRGVHVQNKAVKGQAVNHCSDHRLVLEHAQPVCEDQVGADNCTPSFTAIGDCLEEEFGLMSVEG